VFTFPAASEKTPLAIETVPSPEKFAERVKVAVYVPLVPLKLESVPPVTAMSEIVKLVEGSVSVKVRVAVCLKVKVFVLLVIATEGGVVSNAGVPTAGFSKCDVLMIEAQFNESSWSKIIALIISASVVPK
jgi:hypothetical protein